MSARWDVAKVGLSAGRWRRQEVFLHVTIRDRQVARVLYEIRQIRRELRPGLPAELVQQLLELPQMLAEGVEVAERPDRPSAPGTDELIITLEPSKRLLVLLAALRAEKIERKAVERTAVAVGHGARGHGGSSGAERADSLRRVRAWGKPGRGRKAAA